MESDKSSTRALELFNHILQNPLEVHATKTAAADTWLEMHRIQKEGLRLQKQALEELQAVVKMQRQTLDKVVSQMQELPKLQHEFQEMRAAMQLLTKHPSMREQREKSVMSSHELEEYAPATGGIHTASTLPDIVPDASKGKEGQPVATYSTHAMNTGEHHMIVAFENSVWDCGMFLGVGPMGCAGSLHMTGVFILNLAMQFIYTSIVAEAFTESSFNQSMVEAFLKFRYNVAHDWFYMDHLRGNSLAARICNGDQSVVMAAAQVESLAIINSYLPDYEEAVFGPHTGILMCSVSLIMWACMVAKEFRRLGDFLSIVHRVASTHQRERRTVLVKEEDSLRIESFSSRRIGIALSVVLIRLFFACVVFHAGMRYLINTISLRDLVMNAVALECVMETDELLFDALAPKPIQSFLASLQPIVVPVSKNPLMRPYKGCGVPAGCISMFVLVSLCVYIPIYLSPTLNFLDKTRGALCDGNQNFVFSTTTYPPGVFWADSVPMGPPGDDDHYFQLFGVRMISKVVHGEDALLTRPLHLPSLEGGTWSLKVVRELGVRESGARSNSLCVDFDRSPLFKAGNSSFPALYMDMLSQALGTEFRSCSDVEVTRYCNAESSAGTMVRMLCPISCKCHLPHSSLILASNSAGCPESCQRIGYYDEARAVADCSDASPAELSQEPFWLNFTGTLAKLGDPATSERPAWAQYTIRMQSRLLANLGCNGVRALHKNLGVDFCDEIGSTSAYLPFHTLRLTCPISCHCHRKDWNDRKNCPLACYSKDDQATLLSSQSMPTPSSSPAPSPAQTPASSPAN